MSKNIQTPMMRQYWDIKSLHTDKILLYRMGDFFEMFFEDAITASSILGIALTSRNKKSQEETPMCGVPAHSIGGNINKLLATGLKVAICDQVEDPKQAKGLVKRAITRILTPGMVYDSDTLERTQAHYIACYEDEILACVDSTTGESFAFTEVKFEDAKRLFSILPIVELVHANESHDINNLEFKGVLSLHESFNYTSNTQDDLNKLISNLKSVRRILSYIHSLGSVDLNRVLKPFEIRNLNGRVDLKDTTVRHLELFNNSVGEIKGSLFHAIDRTQTSSGARLLRSRIAFPLTSKSEINLRLDQAQKWIENIQSTKAIRGILSKVGDIERRFVRTSQSQCHGRDLLALSESIQYATQCLDIADNKENFNELKQLVTTIEKTIVPEPPLTVKQGYVIQKGVDSRLDELIELSTNSQSLILALENREKEKTGINSLKIRYNNVFGYYIEITNTHKDKAPNHYMRKQTLANAERFCTEELIELEKNVLSAQSKRFELEYQIFEDLKNFILEKSSDILKLATLTSELDVATATAWLAVEKRYARPNFIENGVDITHSRHPVIEQTVKQAFTPNTVKIEKGGCLLITGPNMAGKSTVMRQVALIAIMAQAGLYVPAEKAELQIFNHIFTRIGASDQLSQGLSTFMVEMVETSEMLKRASQNSLLILDEIGRGTSTFDGMSLAQAILEHIVQKIGAITLFATHYHELTSLPQVFSQVINMHMKVSESKGEIQFLHTLAPGPAQKSYGIHVAKIAGLPLEVLKKAQSLLKSHEDQSQKSMTGQMSLLEISSSHVLNSDNSNSLLSNEFELKDKQNHEFLDEIKQLQVMNMTPMQALQKILDWQGRLQ